MRNKPKATQSNPREESNRYSGLSNDLTTGILPRPRYDRTVRMEARTRGSAMAESDGPRRDEQRPRRWGSAAYVSVGVLLLVALGLGAFGSRDLVRDLPASPTTALTKLPPLSSAVPKGRLQEETERMSSPSVPPSEHRSLMDYAGRRMRFEGYIDGVLRFLDVHDDGITTSLSTFDSSLRAHAASFDEYQKSRDFLAGLPVTRVNGPSVDGQPADVYRVEFPNQGGEITAEYALIYMDKATGLRFREEWMVGSEVVREVTRRLVASTQELEALLSRASVQASSVGGLESCPG